MPDKPTIPPTPRRMFRPRHRMGHAREYQAAYRLGVKKIRGPLAVFGRPNLRPESRLGLAVPRAVGGAVIRNTIKRRLREAFRALRADMPTGYDLVVNVRPHRTLSASGYCDLLAACWRSIDLEWLRRSGPRGGQQSGDDPHP